MAKLTKEEIIDSLKEMTLVELNDLVKGIEETFGVKAAAPVAACFKPTFSLSSFTFIKRLFSSSSLSTISVVSSAYLR